MLIFSHEKQLFSILAYEKFGQIWSIFILLVTMATVHANQILTIFMLLLGGHYHCVKVSSDSETVRGMGLWEFSGALRELMLRDKCTLITFANESAPFHDRLQPVKFTELIEAEFLIPLQITENEKQNNIHKTFYDEKL